MSNSTHLAVAIAAADTAAALALAQTAVGIATLVEYRLDLMSDFDLPALIAQSPLPAIITCRPIDQGGQFPGPERERRDVLREAIRLKAPLIDIEQEALPDLAALPRARTQIIGSHHDFTGMIGDWASAGLRIRALGADIVKLAGRALSPADALIPLAWLHGLAAPGIGIGMGPDGIATRLLAPRFSHAFLSFAAAGARGTAPGQITAVELETQFGFSQIAGADPLAVMLTPPDVPWATVESYRRALRSAAPAAARPWLLPLPVDYLSPGLLLALQLARVRALICLPDVPGAADLTDFAPAPSFLFPAFLPDPNSFAAFVRSRHLLP